MKTTSIRSLRSSERSAIRRRKRREERQPSGRRLRQRLSRAKLKDAVGIGDDKSYQGYTALLAGGKF